MRAFLRDKTRYSKTLGCSQQEFVCYIEKQFQPGMTWENYGTEWELDHINPLAIAYEDGPTDFAQACHYTNLQPLWKSEHQLKTADDINKLIILRSESCLTL